MPNALLTFPIVVPAMVLLFHLFGAGQRRLRLILVMIVLLVGADWRRDGLRSRFAHRTDTSLLFVVKLGWGTIVLIMIQRILMAPIVRVLLHLLGMVTVHDRFIQIFNHVAQVFVHVFGFAHRRSSLLCFRYRMQSLSALMDMARIVLHQLLNDFASFVNRLAVAFHIDQLNANFT